MSVGEISVVSVDAPGWCSVWDLIAGFVTGFILFLGNLGTVLLIVSPGHSTVPITIYNYLHYGSHEAVCALCLVLVLLICGAAALLHCLFKNSRTKLFL
ncbi:MAG: hypothetical protein JXB48_04010 [Candidatus Latescibacteria bacterium]|nr:hypothetical protein [Candidatus Latescibacterota bacterium]